MLNVADPSQVGAGLSGAAGSTSATLLIYPISRGSGSGTTTVAVSDSLGGNASVAVTQDACGRPSDLESAALVYPSPNSTGVATSTTVLYFAIGASTGSTPRLHLIVGLHGTLEGSTLSPATPPASVNPTPPSGTTYMAATVAGLPASATIMTQIYDDSCQAPLLAGSFST